MRTPAQRCSSPFWDSPPPASVQLLRAGSLGPGGRARGEGPVGQVRGQRATPRRWGPYSKGRDHSSYLTQSSPPTLARNSSRLLRKATFCLRSMLGGELLGGVLLADSLLKASASRW